MCVNPTPLTRLIITLSILVEKSIEQKQPVAIYPTTLLQAMWKSDLTFHQGPTLTVRTNGRLISEHTPDFIVHDKSGEIVVVCLISAYQTKPADIDETQACLDAYCENAIGFVD